MIAPPELSRAPSLNAGVFVFVNEAAHMVRPRIHFEALCPFLAVNGNTGAPPSAFVSELHQSLNAASEKGDPTVGIGVDLFCAAPDLDALRWFFSGLEGVSPSLRAEGIEVRVFCFAPLQVAQMSGWLELFDQVAKSGTASGGGLILLSSRFRDVTLDRRATYPVLSRLMRTFAYTRKRGFPADDKFAAWRNRRTYGIHLAVLEGYVCQHPLTFAEYLVDNAIWRHLYPAFSSYVRQLFQVNSSRSLGPLGGVFEADILKAAETAKGIEDVAEGLQASEGSLGGAVRLRRALVDWRNLAVPPTPETHAFEVCYPAGDDAELQEYVESAVQALFQEFPIPVHPYCESQGALSERLRRVRGESIVCVRSKMLHRFREWSLKAHRTWMRPSDPVTVRAQALLQAIGGTVLQCEPTNLRGAAADVEYWLRFLSPFPHVDPEVSGDEREKLCPGVERIQFIHLMPLAPELTC